MNAKDRAMHAQAILDNPVFKEAIGMLRSVYQSQIENSTADDKEGRERSYYALKASTEFQVALTAMIENGKLDQVRETKQQKQKKAK